MEIENKIEIGKYKSIIKDLNKDNEDIRGRLLQLSKDNVNYKNQIKLLNSYCLIDDIVVYYYMSQGRQTTPKNIIK